MRKRLGKYIFNPSRGQVARIGIELLPPVLPCACHLAPGLPLRATAQAKGTAPSSSVSRVLHLISADAHMDAEMPLGSMVWQEGHQARGDGAQVLVLAGT